MNILCSFIGRTNTKKYFLVFWPFFRKSDAHFKMTYVIKPRLSLVTCMYICSGLLIFTWFASCTYPRITISGYSSLSAMQAEWYIFRLPQATSRLHVFYTFPQTWCESFSSLSVYFYFYLLFTTLWSKGCDPSKNKLSLYLLPSPFPYQFIYIA